MKSRIDGMGLFCTLGEQPDEVYAAMCAGQEAFRPIWRFDSSPYQQKLAGQISRRQEEKLREMFPEDDLAGAVLKHSIEQALRQAGKNARSQARRALVLASNFGPLEAQEWLWREKIDNEEVSPESCWLVEEFVASIAESYDCQAASLQLSMSCASGLAALQLGMDLLHSGRADEVIVAAYDLLSEFSWCGLHNLRTITADTMRPFDLRRSGTLFSEGAATVLLSREEAGSAEAGAPQALVLAAASNNNAFHITAPPPQAEGSRRVMLEALRLAGLRPEAIEHVCAHATSTVANDSSEAGALRNIFGQRLPELSVAAHKSQLGHLLGAAGLAELIITVLAMQNGLIPPTLHHEQLDPQCQGIDCIAQGARHKIFDCALINSAGIGGNNAAAVLSKVKSKA
ncbi:MAG: beta-ketoacyl synthase N-terminal-like domain-containing protein [Lentisphaeria bacterium]|jgi:3-oxoacyl-[acyl-carrier-protein] synthase II